LSKNAPFHIKSPVKNFHGQAKGGGIAPCPPLNTPLGVSDSRSWGRRWFDSRSGRC